MDINFKQGTQADFNTSVFTEGDICFVNQSDSNDYIYRIGTSGAKIGIIGDGYLINDTEFKILKPIINSNNVKIGDMISAIAGTSNYEVPSIIGYNATQDGLISNRYLMLDIGNNTSGAIIPNPNKDIDLGLIDARWNTIYTENILVNKYYYSKTNTARAISIDECAFNSSLIYPMIQGFGGPEHKVLALDGGTSTMTDDIHIVPNPERTGIKHLGHEANTLRWKLFSNAINNSGDIDNSGKITTKTLSVNSNYINNTTAADGVGVDSSFHPNKQNEYNLGWNLRRWKSLYLGTDGLNTLGNILMADSDLPSMNDPHKIYSANVKDYTGLGATVKWTNEGDTRNNYTITFARETGETACIAGTYNGNTSQNSYINLGTNKAWWNRIYCRFYTSLDDDNHAIQIRSASYSTYKYPMIVGCGNTDQYLCLDVRASDDLTKNIYIMPNPQRTGSKNLGYNNDKTRWTNIYSVNINASGAVSAQNINTSGTIMPSTSNTGSVGNQNKYYQNGGFYTIYYSSTGKVSDKRLKEEQSSEILKQSLQIYDLLTPICYKYKNILPQDDFSRTHIGFYAQDINNLINESGLTSEDCSLVMAAPIGDETPDEIKEICLDGYKYHVNYEELHGLHTLKNHQQDTRLAELEEKNKELENTISELKTQIELFKLAMGG